MKHFTLRLTSIILALILAVSTVSSDVYAAGQMEQITFSQEAQGQPAIEPDGETASENESGDGNEDESKSEDGETDESKSEDGNEDTDKSEDGEDGDGDMDKSEDGEEGEGGEDASDPEEGTDSKKESLKDISEEDVLGGDYILPSADEQYNRIMLVDGSSASGTGWSYDAETKTLTLNGYDESGYTGYSSDYPKAQIVATDDLNLVISGENRISGSGIDYAIHCSGNLTISGTGSLTIERVSTGIYTGKAITIDGPTITSGDISCGINAYWGDISINGGQVSVTNDIFSDNSHSIVIAGGSVTAKVLKSTYDLTISGGTVTAAFDNFSSTEGTLTVSGGQIVAKGYSGYPAFYINQLVMTGGSIQADPADGRDSSSKVMLLQLMKEFTDGTIVCNGGFEDRTFSYTTGKYAGGTITINGEAKISQLKMSAGQMTVNGPVIGTSSVEFSGGNLSITNPDGDGIHMTSCFAVKVSGGTLSIDAAGYGICADGSGGGTITFSSGESYIFGLSQAIITTGTLTIEPLFVTGTKYDEFYYASPATEYLGEQYIHISESGVFPEKKDEGDLLYVDGAQIVGSVSKTGYSYDAAKKLLTLDGFTATGSKYIAGKSAVIYAGGDITIVYKNTNEMNISADYGIYCAGKVNLSGEGTLTIGTATHGIYGQKGIATECGTITINTEDTGITAYWGDYVQGSGRVNVNKIEALNGGDVVIQNGSVFATVIHATGDMTIRGGIVQAALDNYYDCQGVLTISGGHVTAKGYLITSGSSQYKKAGLYARTLVMNGGEVDVSTYANNSDIVAMWIDSVDSISDGRITCNGIFKNTLYSYTDNYSGGNVTINGEADIRYLKVAGGTVTINGKAVSTEVVLTDGELTINNEEGDGFSADSLKKVSVTGGTLRVSAYGDYGIPARANGGTVTFSGGEAYILAGKQAVIAANPIGIEGPFETGASKDSAKKAEQYFGEKYLHVSFNGNISEGDGTGNVLYVNGKKITGNAQGTGYQYDQDTNTLILNGFTDSDYYYSAGKKIGIYAESDLNLKVLGINTISTKVDYGIYCEGKLVLMGTGSLAISDAATGIYGHKGVTSVGGTYQINDSEHGILAFWGDFQTTASTFEVQNDILTQNGGDIRISGGTITATVLASDHDIAISGGTVNAALHNVRANEGVLSISGGQINAKTYWNSPSDMTYQEAVSVYQINMTDGELNMSLGDDEPSAKTIFLAYVGGDISGGTIRSEHGCSFYMGWSSHGITGGTVEITGDAFFDQLLMNGGNLIVNGGRLNVYELNMKSGNLTVHNFLGNGIWNKNLQRIMITGGTVDVQASGVGIWAEGNGGNITVKGGNTTVSSTSGQALKVATSDGITVENNMIMRTGATKESKKVAAAYYGEKYVEFEEIPGYCVHFETGDSRVTVEDQTVLVNCHVSQPTLSSRSGYSFEGWYTSDTNQNSETIWDFDKDIVTEDITLYAKWTGNPYTITFNPNNGTLEGNDTKVVTFGENYGALPTPVREGYNFGGWWTSSSSGTRILATTKVSYAGARTLYAHWNPCECIVSFDSCGGTEVPNKISVYYGKYYPTLPTTTREGYTFKGWYTEKEGGKQITPACQVSITEDQTLYARWAANRVSITFDRNGGSGSSSSIVRYYDQVYGELTTPTKSGYRFDGWWTAVEGGTKILSTTVVKIAENHTLYAHWTEIGTVTVMLDATGGTVDLPSIGVVYGSQYGTLPTPVKAGHKFDGWFTAAEGGTQLSSYTEMMQENTHTIYAHWTVKTARVYFSAGSGASVDATDITVTYGEEYGALPTPTKSGYRFDGWWTESSGGTRILPTTKAEFEYTQYYIYAHWSKPVVTFDLCGGSYAGDLTRTVLIGKTYGTLPMPTYSGCDFEGWWTAKVGGTEITSSSVVTNEADHTIYAHWTRKEFDVVLDPDDSELTRQTITVVFGEPYGELPVLSTPEDLKGYVFAGWYTGREGAGEKITKDTIVNLTNNIRIYAYWEPATYTVTFDPKGGSVSPATKQVVYLQQYGDLPVATRTGYQFKGWSEREGIDYCISANYPVMSKEDFTLYAVWTAKQYTVTLHGQGGMVDSKEIAERTQTFGEKYMLPTPVRTGYHFDGWYDAVEGGSLVNTDTVLNRAEAHDLYAHWSGIESTVSFLANGGSVETASKKVVYDQAYGTLPVPTRSGYRFDGWYTSSTGGSLVEKDDIVSITYDQRLYAHWSVRTYLITFDGQGVTVDSSKNKNLTVGQTYGTLPSVGRNGYTFDGWYTAAEGGVKISSTDTFSGTEDQVLYAHWTGKTITVRFYKTISSYAYIETKEVTFGSPFGTLPTPTYDSYVFSGWYTKENGTWGTLITEDSIVDSTSTISLYAGWGYAKVTVSYDTNGGGTCDVTSNTQYVSKRYSNLPKAVSNRPGYYFSGWFTAAEGGTYVGYGTVVNNSEDHTLYARWELKSYYLTYDPGEGTCENIFARATYGEKYSELVQAKRYGYAFNGWQLEDGTVIWPVSTCNLIGECDQEYVITALWEPKQWYVTFYNGQYEVGALDRSITLTYGQNVVALPVLEAEEGYRFDGWYTQDQGKGTRVTEDLVITKEYEYRTLYAHFVPAVCSITLDPNGGTVSSATQDVLFKSKYGSMPVPTRDGYSFAGWYTQAEGGELITADTVLDTTPIPGALYAHWDVNTYTLTFDENGGIRHGLTKEVAYDDAYGELPTPEREGASFIGWYTDPKEGSRIVPETIVKTATDATLYAHWKYYYQAEKPVSNLPCTEEIVPGRYVTLSSDTVGAKIYFTMDPAIGMSVDDTTGTAYDTVRETGIRITQDTTIYAIAVADGYKDSDVAVLSFTVKNLDLDFGQVTVEDAAAMGFVSARQIPEGLWAAGLQDAEYTGLAIKQTALHVYDNKTRLTEGTDYTLRYRNNIKTGTASVVITGKGAHKGTVVLNFTISPLSLGTVNEQGEIINDSRLTAPDVAYSYTGKAINGTTKVTYQIGGRSVSLVSGRDFTYEYPGDMTGGGAYTVKLVGKGNYTGNASFTQTISASRILISKVTLERFSVTCDYTGEAVTLPADQEPKLTDRSGASGAYQLVKGTDYELEYRNNNAVGTAQIIIKGIGNYMGTRTVNFKIAGVPLSKVKITGADGGAAIVAKTYNGAGCVQDNYVLIYQATAGVTPVVLAEGVDYTVSYENNVDVGSKAVIIFTGKGKYIGSIRKNFRIDPYQLAEEDVTPAVIGAVPYTKGGAIPNVSVTALGSELICGTDYTVRVINNLSSNDGTGKKKPTITITGKGNYKGTITRTFAIEKGSFEHVTFAVSDIVASKRAGTCNPTIVLTENGTRLVAGRDYSRTITYRYAADTRVTRKEGLKTREYVVREGTAVDLRKDIIPAGTRILATIEGLGEYAGQQKEVTFRYVVAKLDRATVKIGAKQYSGAEVRLTASDLEVMVSGQRLTGSDYEIIGYQNNKTVGTATVTLQGIGLYSGRKTVTFRITN